MSNAQLETVKASGENTEKIRQILAGVLRECVIGREVSAREVWRRLQADNIPLAEIQEVLEDKELLAEQGASDQQIIGMLGRGTGGAEQFKAWLDLKSELTDKVNWNLFLQKLARSKVWNSIAEYKQRLGL